MGSGCNGWEWFLWLLSRRRCSPQGFLWWKGTGAASSAAGGCEELRDARVRDLSWREDCGTQLRTAKGTGLQGARPSALPTPAAGCQTQGEEEEQEREVTHGFLVAEPRAGAGGLGLGVMRSARCMVCRRLTGITCGTLAQSRAPRSARSEEQTSPRPRPPHLRFCSLLQI